MKVIIPTLALIAAIHIIALRAAQDVSTLAPIVRTERAAAGVVRVVYDLNGAPGALFSVWLEASNDGGRTFAIRPRAVTGDVGAGVSPGPNKAIAWDTTKDVDDLQVDRFVFRVVVSGGGQPTTAASGEAVPAAAGARGAASSPGSPASTAGPGGTRKGGGLSKGAIIAIAGGGGAAVGVGVAAKGKAGATTPPSPVTRNFTAQISAPITFRFSTCVRDEVFAGTLLLRLAIAANGAVTGDATAGLSTRVTAVNAFCSPTSPQPGSTGTNTVPSTQVTVTTGQIVFSGKSMNPNTAPGPRTDEWSFTGSLASDVVTGTLDLTITYSATATGAGGLGATTFNVTAR